jgi:hypothetical protein
MVSIDDEAAKDNVTVTLSLAAILKYLRWQ